MGVGRWLWVVCAQSCVSMEARNLNRSVPQSLSTLLLETRSLTEPVVSPFWLDWLSSKPPGPPVSIPLSLLQLGMAALMCSCGKHLTSPVPLHLCHLWLRICLITRGTRSRYLGIIFPFQTLLNTLCLDSYSMLSCVLLDCECGSVHGIYTKAPELTPCTKTKFFSSEKRFWVTQVLVSVSTALSYLSVLLSNTLALHVRSVKKLLFKDLGIVMIQVLVWFGIFSYLMLQL